jgi:LPXTG-site transpeptidase (sortase) family protein
MKILGYPIKTPYREGESIVVYDAQVSKRFFLISRSFGFFFLCFSLVGLIYLLTPVISSEFYYRIHSLQNKTVVVEEPAKPITKPVVKYFELIIPKIGLETKVFANIDSSDEKEYQEILGKGIAHAQGTFFPGENGPIYLFGHSTNYQANVSKINAIFYLLKNLEPEDKIEIIYQGKTFIYKVAEKKITKPDDLSAINSNSDGEKLILQTCWPPGTTWHRLLVIAYPIT